MGGVRRRPGWSRVLPAAALWALFGVAGLAAAASPAGAASSARAEQLITIDGHYQGTMTVDTVEVPPDIAEALAAAGIVLTPGDVYPLALDIATDGAGGGWADITVTGTIEGQLGSGTRQVPITWDGTILGIRLDDELGQVEWSGAVAQTGDSVTISGNFRGEWGIVSGIMRTGTWGVTRLLSDGGGIPAQPGTDDGETSGAGEVASGSPPSGDVGVFPKGGWSPAGVAVLILVVILVLIATGIGVKEAVAKGLVEVMESPKDEAIPKVRAVGPAVRAVGRHLIGSGMPVTVSGPVQPWSQPDTATPRAGFVLQPGGRYVVVASTGPGPDHWVLVASDSAGVEGWVHRSALAPWQQEIPTARTPPVPTGAWERVHFPNPFLARVSGSELQEYLPGEYRLGPPDQNGYRQITDTDGKPLPGTIHARQVPPPPNQPAGGVPAAPPPPPPPPPPSSP